MSIPYVDPSVRFVGASKLREMDRAALSQLDHAMVITTPDGPAAVLLPYATYMLMQDAALRDGGSPV